MDLAYHRMEESLNDFHVHRHDYNIFKHDQMEVLTNTRVVKQEVIDISETMDLLIETVHR